MADTSLPSGQSVQQICDLVTGITRALVDQPESIRIEAVPAESEIALRLFVTEDDLGKLIGKQGRTARSLRAIVGAASSKLRLRCSLDIRADV